MRFSRAFSFFCVRARSSACVSKRSRETRSHFSRLARSTARKLSSSSPRRLRSPGGRIPASLAARRSEEHTSELQSLMRISYAVFCLKKKNEKNNTDYTPYNHKQHARDIIHIQ